MKWTEQERILTAAQVSLDHPSFFPRIFSLLARRKANTRFEEGFEIFRICSQEYDEISQSIDKVRIQESCSVRNVLRTRELAKALINEEGELIDSLIPKFIGYLQAHLYSLGPERQYDGKRQEHILSVLKLLHGNKELRIMLKRVSKPYSHRFAEQIIRDTLELPVNTVVTDVHARRAVLSAWMCLLRQSVGSCFATAPAIIIQSEQPDMFLRDLYDLISTGQLKRTFGGVEYSVPLSTSWGVGDLKKQFLMHRKITEETTPIWLLPSCLRALETTGIIDSFLPVKEKILKLKGLIISVLKDWEGTETGFLVSMEEIFSRLLMRRYKISPTDLNDYDQRPRPMLHASLMIQIPKSSLKSGGKGEACSLYYQQMEIARNVFKSYADNALLKTWEFSLASFAESKANFARWNLYASLGLGPEEQGGIGQCIYSVIKRRLDDCNVRVQDLQGQYEQAYSQLKYVEGRLKQASEGEIHWLKIEYQVKSQEFYALQELRDKIHGQAKRLAGLFDVLIDLFDAKFPEYFQEVYDAEMHGITARQYDDSPAGFRLLFKHGRSNTSQWTNIKNSQEFIEALISFFTAAEHEIISDERLIGLEEAIAEIITTIVHHIKTLEFIETAFHRMAIAHQMPIIKNPLENLDKIEKKPWMYTSGGTMGTLVSCYYKREQKPSEVTRWVENEIELLMFFIDTLKQMPYSLTREYASDPKKSFLMHSPTHAFLLKPGLPFFKEGWQSDLFTYTWIRDVVVLPMKNFIDRIILNNEMIQFLLSQLTKLVPLGYQSHFQGILSRSQDQMRPKEFRDQILEHIQHDSMLARIGGLILSPEIIDSMLFRSLPLFPSHQLKERVRRIVEHLSEISTLQSGDWMNLLDLMTPNLLVNQIMSAKQLKDITLSLITLAQLSTDSPVDLHARVTSIMRQLEYAMPAPLIFADSNWTKDEFGFLVNPGNEQFELWKMDYTGAEGSPMSSWKKWLNGSQRDIFWGIYNHPYEYK